MLKVVDNNFKSNSNSMNKNKIARHNCLKITSYENKIQKLLITVVPR